MRSVLLNFSSKAPLARPRHYMDKTFWLHACNISVNSRTPQQRQEASLGAHLSAVCLMASCVCFGPAEPFASRIFCQ